MRIACADEFFVFVRIRIQHEGRYSEGDSVFDKLVHIVRFLFAFSGDLAIRNQWHIRTGGRATNLVFVEHAVLHKCENLVKFELEKNVLVFVEKVYAEPKDCLDAAS